MLKKIGKGSVREECDRKLFLLWMGKHFSVEFLGGNLSEAPWLLETVKKWVEMLIFCLIELPFSLSVSLCFLSAAEGGKNR